MSNSLQPLDYRLCYPITHQALLSLGFPRQEYWSGLPYALPRDLSNPGIEPTSPALAGGFFTTEALGEPYLVHSSVKYY